jgi:putative hydrolase of the HAD superfamily
MKPIISFDLDGTLMKPGFGDIVWLEGLPKVYANHHHIDVENAKTFFKQAYDTIGSDKREWYDLSFWIQKYHLPITPRELLDQYESSIELYHDVCDVLDQLSKSYTLIISSGAMKEFIIKELEYTGIRQYFDYLFSSTTDTTTVKKDPSFYTMIAKILEIPPHHIIHIGDNIDYDYHAPTSAGLHAYVLDRIRNHTQPPVLSSLKEFAAAIEKDQTN